ncbi:CopD family protein [Nocardiopsis sp. CT-R113]|uniref:CopD family protein n=1 Tax=Nocardiopsis codii TaxID=3065942 RepID=A0ABU7K6Q9_9ACTN|nr:CopD family protein [Nocardiopsis sp. CT-R113]MEE2037937.1 CopD family protein [Nocardiopsis sp. CT-R113]
MAPQPPPDSTEGATSSVPPVDTASYTRSEATRLLCAGAYLDTGFRATAITELIERTVPPSLGFDAAVVLRHCLRARDLDVKAAGLVLAVLVAGILAALLGITAWENPAAMQMGQYALASLGLFVLAGLLARGRQALRGQSESPLAAGSGGATDPVGRAHRLLALPLGLFNVALLVLWIVPAWLLLWNGHVLAATAVLSPPVLLLAIGVWHLLALSRILCTELARHSFTGKTPGPLPAPFAERRAGTLAAIGKEQFSRLVLYNEDEPFLGAGKSYRPWSLALELERRSGDADGAEPLDGRRVLDLITPQLAKLAEASSRTSRDRLKDLELQECVFLPAGLPTGARRAGLLYEDGNVRAHLDEAAGEGAEQRRHFLRIRVGGWEEEVVTTVFVRVHTQGDLLILEVLPYVLPPLRSNFHEVDTFTEQSTRFRLSTLVTAPAVTVSVLACGASTLKAWWCEWRGLAGGETPQAPRVSIRELGSRDTRSMFQEMDVNRYVRTIQDRITSGAQQALAEAGYRTEEFQRQVVNISRGGVFIGGSMNGSIATGAGAQAVTVTDQTVKDKEKK